MTTTLRLHRDVYRGGAVDEAVKLFASHARFELREEAAYWVVMVTARTAARERQVSGELANYALGLTVKSGGSETR